MLLSRDDMERLDALLAGAVKTLRKERAKGGDQEASYRFVLV
jgi:hypothetical protein